MLISSSIYFNIFLTLISGHVAKKTFLIAYIHVTLLGKKHAACRNLTALAVVLHRYMLFKSFSSALMLF